jgi:hypothetical protein
MLAQHDGGYAGSSDKKKPRRSGAQVYGLYVVYGHCGMILGSSAAGQIRARGLVPQRKESRWRGAFRRLVLAPRGLTGLLNPYAKSGTRLFQPYFMNCFNCASPAVPIHQ